MNTQVYFHRIRRIYDYYLKQYSTSWGKEHYHGLGDVLLHDDMSVMMEIRKDAKVEGPRQKWARRIVERQHHVVVYETGDNSDHGDLETARRILRRLKQSFDDVDFFLDDLPVSIYKLWIPGQSDAPKVQHLYIRERDGRAKILAKDSVIIGKFRKMFEQYGSLLTAKRAGLSECVKW